MKREFPKPSFRRGEVVAIVCVLSVFVVWTWIAVTRAKRKSERMSCVHSLQSIGGADRAFDLFTKSVSMGATNDVADFFVRNANFTYQWSTPATFHCPADKTRVPATSWTNFSSSNVSYFFNLSADNANPHSIKAGDSDLIVNGQPLRSGINSVDSKAQFSWSKRHAGSSFVLMRDGSIQQLNPARMQGTLGGAGTNAAVLLAP